MKNLQKFSCWIRLDGIFGVHFQPGEKLYDFEKDEGFVLNYIVEAKGWEEALIIHEIVEAGYYESEGD